MKSEFDCLAFKCNSICVLLSCPIITEWYTAGSLPLQTSSAERGKSSRAQIEGFGTDSSAKSSPVARCNQGRGYALFQSSVALLLCKSKQLLL